MPNMYGVFQNTGSLLHFQITSTILHSQQSYIFFTFTWRNKTKTAKIDISIIRSKSLCEFTFKEVITFKKLYKKY